MTRKIPAAPYPAYPAGPAGIPSVARNDNTGRHIRLAIGRQTVRATAEGRRLRMRWPLHGWVRVSRVLGELVRGDGGEGGGGLVLAGEGRGLHRPGDAEGGVVPFQAVVEFGAVGGADLVGEEGA